MFELLVGWGFDKISDRKYFNFNTVVHLDLLVKEFKVVGIIKDTLLVRVIRREKDAYKTRIPGLWFHSVNCCWWQQEFMLFFFLQSGKGSHHKNGPQREQSEHRLTTMSYANIKQIGTDRQTYRQANRTMYLVMLAIGIKNTRLWRKLPKGKEGGWGWWKTKDQYWTKSNYTGLSWVLVDSIGLYYHTWFYHTMLDHSLN